MIILDETALETAVAAWVREMLKNSRRPDLLARFDAGGIEEVRKWAAKNPSTVEEIRVAVKTYIAAVGSSRKGVG